jgi:hypothetical protein
MCEPDQTDNVRCKLSYEQMNEKIYGAQAVGAIMGEGWSRSRGERERVAATVGIGMEGCASVIV